MRVLDLSKDQGHRGQKDIRSHSQASREETETSCGAWNHMLTGAMMEVQLLLMEIPGKGQAAFKPILATEFSVHIQSVSSNMCNRSNRNLSGTRNGSPRQPCLRELGATTVKP